MTARNPRFLVLLALIAAVATACTAKPLPDKTPVSVSPLTMGTNEWREVDQVFVVTDASGTMYAQQTFPEAKALSRSFIQSMPDSSQRARDPQIYQASLIAFGGEDRVVAPLGSFDRSALEAKASEAQVMGEIDGRGGMTPYRRVFEEIRVALKGSRGKAAVVLFTDGLPDFEDQAMRAARRLVASHPDGVCFHGVKTGVDPAGSEFLNKLAALTPCGSVTPASNLQTASAMTEFSRGVFTGAAPGLPAVAAPSACEGVIRLRGVEFGFDRADITDDSRVILDVAIQELSRCPNVRLSVDGHTCSIGPEDYNQGLSERRAGAVADYLSGAGVQRGRMTPQGFGEAKPLVPNDTKDGRARNRRVELIPAR